MNTRAERVAPPAVAALNFPTLPPLSLYVHLPWCVRKCPYCDFNSYEARGELPEQPYVDAVLRDLDTEARFAFDRPLASIFVGGGTPSLFSGAAIARLLAGVRARLPLEADAEITLEANPGAVEAERFAAYREAGVNRLSIGVQSFRAPELHALGRIHSAHDAVRAFELARRAGFENVNLDLMYGLPKAGVDGALEDLAQALALEPAHISWYQLTIEPSTAFHRRPPPLPADDTVIEIEHRGRELLARRGYRRYEISAYARSGKTCTHNLNYWQFGDYLGVGAGAHGKVTLAAEQAIERRSKVRNPRTYAAATLRDAETVERIDAAPQVALEFLMNALRLVDGVPAACFEQRAGQTLAAVCAPVEEAVARGWLADSRGELRPTAAGLRLLNRLLELFC
jgi:putative oxygen-independent coproporphyrinogen III oxidase